MNEEINKKEKKTVKSLYIVVILLFIVILGLGSFMFLNKDNDKSKDNIDTKEETNKPLDINSELILKLDFMSGSTINTSSMIKECLYSHDVTHVKDMSIECKENLFWSYLTKYASSTTNDNKLYYQASTVKTAWKELFGLNDSYPLAGKTVNGLSYSQDGSLTIPASGRFEGLYVLKQDIVDVVETEDEIVLSYDVKFIKPDTTLSNNDVYYSDYEMTNEVEKDSRNKVNYEKVFKKDTNGNFYFYSVRRIQNTENSSINENNETVFAPAKSEIINKVLAGAGNSCNDLEIFTTNKKIEAKDIPNYLAYQIAIQKGKFTNRNEITLSELRSVISTYFGKDYIYNPINLNDGYFCPIYEYDETSETYTLKSQGCGGECGPSTTYHVINSLTDNNVEIIDTKVIFTKCNESGTCDGNYYSDYEKTKLIGSWDDYSESLFSKGTTYRFTFKIENGNYIFVSVAPLNQ